LLPSRNIILDFFSASPDKPIMGSLIFRTGEALDELQKMLDEAGLRRADVLAEAGVSRVTWWRWRRGMSPNIESLNSILRAIEKLSAGRQTQA
jgi:predicted transcriptional regulator